MKIYQKTKLELIFFHFTGVSKSIYLSVFLIIELYSLLL